MPGTVDISRQTTLQQPAACKRLASQNGLLPMTNRPVIDDDTDRTFGLKPDVSQFVAAVMPYVRDIPGTLAAATI